MSDQYGSFDNPYGGKPPFEGQEPPVQQPVPPPPPTPYAPNQPQGWGQVPPGYGQAPPGYGQVPPGYAQPQPGYGQPPAYLPYYPPKQVDPDARPGTVTAAAVMTIVGAVISLLISLFMVPAGIADYNDPSSSDKGVTLTMVIWFVVCGVLSLAAIPLGIIVLFRSKVARILLTVIGSIAALLSIFVVLYPALIITALVMLYAGRAGAWFARRAPGDPWQQPVVAPPGTTPPTHQRY
ncbi:hypothetical protein FB381_0692 [Nocardioides albertanoniae]|uniref:Uncharacterized protein n=1 Tax=Nocardioides albertanoniae TaxID=1175486 RepID=A0A543A2Y7_9ACTN|nr:DUF4064 domain-containing protein [Nocardioides albertanoniae]TQL66826.1 hypothetical protein FB381_0692 [Nocardioides albertanoniae]